MEGLKVLVVLAKLVELRRLGQQLTVLRLERGVVLDELPLLSGPIHVDMVRKGSNLRRPD